MCRQHGERNENGEDDPPLHAEWAPAADAEGDDGRLRDSEGECRREHPSPTAEPGEGDRGDSVDAEHGASVRTDDAAGLREQTGHRRKGASGTKATRTRVRTGSPMTRAHRRCRNAHQGATSAGSDDELVDRHGDHDPDRQLPEGASVDAGPERQRHPGVAAGRAGEGGEPGNREAEDGTEQQRGPDDDPEPPQAFPTPRGLRHTTRIPRPVLAAVTTTMASSDATAFRPGEDWSTIAVVEPVTASAEHDGRAG